MQLEWQHTTAERSVSKNEELIKQIRMVSVNRIRRHKSVTRLRISFDVFCSIVEYDAFLRSGEGSSVFVGAFGNNVTSGNARNKNKAALTYAEQVIRSDALFFNTLYDALEVSVDFFAPSMTIQII